MWLECVFVEAGGGVAVEGDGKGLGEIGFVVLPYCVLSAVVPGDV